MISLVTGGAGFVGAHVVNQLIEEGHQVIVLDDLSGGFMENVHPDAIFIQGSIVDDALLAGLFNKYKFDYVYHLAAYAAEGLSHFVRRFNYTNNLIGSVNLINQSVNHKIKCFVFTSSIAVYGNAAPPMSELSIPQPADPYGVAKYAVELDLKAANDLFGLNYVILRPHNLYGELQNISDKYRNVIGIFMNQLMLGQPLTIFGDGSQTRAFSYIGDVAPQIAGCIHIPAAINQIFNIGADKEYTLNELANTIMNVLELHQPIKYLPVRKEVVHAYSDHTKANEVFGLQKTSTALIDGIKKMAAWAKLAGPRKSMTFNGIEIAENLPEIWLDTKA